MLRMELTLGVVIMITASMLGDRVVAARWSQEPAKPTEKTRRAGDAQGTIRVRLFVDDADQEPQSDWSLELECGGAAVKLEQISKDGFIIGDVADRCSIRFGFGNNQVLFEKVSGHLLRCGGDLLIALILKPTLLDNEVNLASGEVGHIDKFSDYYDARSSVATAWRKLSPQQQHDVGRGVFYRFVPHVFGDPVAETGYYFVLAK